MLNKNIAARFDMRMATNGSTMSNEECIHALDTLFHAGVREIYFMLANPYDHSLLTEMAKFAFNLGMKVNLLAGDTAFDAKLSSISEYLNELTIFTFLNKQAASDEYSCSKLNMVADKLISENKAFSQKTTLLCFLGRSRLNDISGMNMWPDISTNMHGALHAHNINIRFTTSPFAGDFDGDWHRFMVAYLRTETNDRTHRHLGQLNLAVDLSGCVYPLYMAESPKRRKVSIFDKNMYSKCLKKYNQKWRLFF